MKRFDFIIQSKGGVGKSFLTYMLAARYQLNEEILFCDADASTQTSTSQLKFLAGNRLANINLLDDKKKIQRDKIFEILEELNQFDQYNQFVIDFGAPESEQFPALVSVDFTISDLKKFEKYLNADFVINVVLAGGTAYTPSAEYLKEIVKSFSQFKILIWLNQSTFDGFNFQINDIKEVASKLDITVKPFGDLSQGGISNAIVINIEKGGGPDDLKNFMARTKLYNELQKVELA